MSGEICTDNLLNQAGDGAPDFPAGMPTVGGVPVVASGSNNDGKWVKFASGDIICRSRIILEQGTHSGTFQFPMAFGSFDSSGGAGIQISYGGFASGAPRLSEVEIYPTGNGSFLVSISDTINVDCNIQYVAHGRDS